MDNHERELAAQQTPAEDIAQQADSLSRFLFWDAGRYDRSGGITQ